MLPIYLQTHETHNSIAIALRLCAAACAASVKAAIERARGSVKLDLSALAAIAGGLPAVALPFLRGDPHVAHIEEDVKRNPLALSTPSKKPYLPGPRLAAQERA